MVSALTQLKDKLKTTRVGRVGKNSSQKKHLQASQKKKESRVQLANMTRSQRENNPFELKFTKQKHEILGRKVKGINGRPGVTRKLGLENRARTLGVELKNKNRTSMVIDKRFGENDKSMSVEDKMLARLMKEKTKGIRSNAAFNLDDDTDLTHGGNALSNMDAFDDAGLEAVENDSDDGNIDASIVKYTHFGGFDDDNGDPNARKSRNEIMKERERQAQKEHDLDLVEQVDAELDEIRGLLAPMSDRHQPASEGRMTIANDRLAFIRGDVTVRPSEDPTEIRKKEQDDKEHVEFQPMTIDQDYDKFIREMAYDRRARPTDRTLTEEEIAAKQVLDLERSEKDRHDRMNGVNPESNTKRPKPVWKSEGDDLGDDDYANIIQEQVNDEEEQPLTYKDGVLINDQIFMSAAADSGSDSEDGSVSSSEGGSENDKTLDAEDSIEADVIEAENGALYESASESEKGESDLEIDDKEGIEDFKNAKSAGDEIIDDSETKIAKAELPFTFEAPQSYEEMLELFNGRKTSEHVVIVERLRVLNNAKLGPAQKANLESLMTYVVEHVGAIASSLPIDMEYVKQFETQSQILATQFPQRFAIMCKAKLISFRNTFNRAICHKKKQCMPNLGELLFFKLIHHTFPTSDLDHPVINPAFLLLGQYLGQGMYLSHQDILSGIFVCQLLVERFVPEVVNFLTLICYHCQKGITTVAKSSLVPDLGRIKVSLQILDFKTDVDRLNVGTLLGSGQPFNCSENLKMSILVQSFTLLSQACENSRYATSIIELFEPALALLRKVPVDDLHKNVKVILDNAARRFTVSLEFAMEKRIPLRMQKRKAIAIKSHIPKFESGYSADKKYEPNRERATAQKDKAEYRKEFKGAIRELRRDAQFVNGQRLAERKDKDAAYKKKIDKIVGQLSTQEGTIRGFEREAKKSKKKHSK